MHYAFKYSQVASVPVAFWENGSDDLKVRTCSSLTDKLEFLESLEEGDTVWTVSSGSDVLADLLVRNGVRTYRTYPPALNDYRTEEEGKEDDHLVITRMAQEDPHLFYELREVDPLISEIRTYARARNTVLEDFRRPTQQRLTSIYRDLYLIRGRPDIGIKAYVKAKIQSNPIFKAFKDEEDSLKAELASLLRETPLFEELFETIRGCGPVISGTIIGEYGDVRFYPTEAKFIAYSGYHVTEDGKFPQRKSGQVANWNPYLRQAVWNFTQVTNRQPADTFWKAKLLERKRVERERHPEVVEVKKPNGKTEKRYTDGHLHNRALRWVGKKLLRYVYRQWCALEGIKLRSNRQVPAE